MSAGTASRWHWPGWAHLPRETRDTLFLLAVIGWTVLPHLQHLPWWCGLLSALVLLWRAQLALTGAILPGRLSVLLVLAVAAGLTLWTQRTLLGKDAGVTMLVVLMALKTLELRARRDALVVFFLGFFLVLTHFLYSQSLPTALAMLVSVWGLLTSLVLAHMPVGRPALARAGWLALRSALLGAPITLALFMLFPRIAPLWGMPSEGSASTGLSGSLELGQVAELASDESIALRVRFPDLNGAPSPDQLYFRGPVLNHFDGRQWRSEEHPNNAPRRGRAPALQLRGPGVAYEMTLEPLRLTLLPLLEMTPALPDAAPQLDSIRLLPQADGVWRTDRPVAERLRFSARAWPQHRWSVNVDPLALRELVELPSGYNPRTMAWAAALRRDERYAQADARTLAQALLTHIRSGGYTYTLAPGGYGKDAVDEFWLDRRQGFCEHFAASFVVLMRALDVPARIVTGYQGTDLLPVDGWYVVRQSHAHAWAEIWQPGEGWLRVDPTAAVAPERIVRSRNLLPPPGLMGQALGAVDAQLLARLRSRWEALGNRWNQWVLGYSKRQQFELLSRLGVAQPSWRDLGLALLLLGSGAALAGAGWAWWDRRRQDPWQRLMARVRRQLTALGLPAPAASVAPRALAQALLMQRGQEATALAEALEHLEQQRYGREARSRPDPAWWPSFRRAARALGPG